MVTARNAGFSAASQQRVEQGAQQTALGEALAQATDWGRQALAMQQSLLAGLVRSQALEAQRLSDLYSPDDERVAAAQARRARYADVQSEILARAQQIGQVVNTFQQDGLFTGYVLQTDGTPAVGYGVVLAFDAVTTRKGVRGGKAATDTNGWFSIDTGLPAPTPAPTTGVVDKPIVLHVERLVDRLMGAATEHQVAPPAPGEPTPGQTSEVAILDPAGKLVFEDPFPPTFADTSSEFRVYTLFSQGGLSQAARRKA